MKYTYLIRGMDGKREAWSCSGHIEAQNIDNALLIAREQTLKDLIGRSVDRVTSKTLDAECNGPYQITQINVELMV